MPRSISSARAGDAGGDGAIGQDVRRRHGDHRRRRAGPVQHSRLVPGSISACCATSGSRRRQPARRRPAAAAARGYGHRLARHAGRGGRSPAVGVRRPDRRDLTETLADDPLELARQIAELAGPDAIVRVDSFEGQSLPPKAQIKSIHVVRDQFAAETAQPGSTFVDVVTQPGIGPIRGGLSFTLRNPSATGQSRFTSTRAPEDSATSAGNAGGRWSVARRAFRRT